MGGVTPRARRATRSRPTGTARPELSHRPTQQFCADAAASLGRRRAALSHRGDPKARRQRFLEIDRTAHRVISASPRNARTRHQSFEGDSIALIHVALRAAIHDALIADSALDRRARRRENLRRAAARRGVSLCDARRSAHRRFSRRRRPTQEHQLTLHAWSRQGGHREAHLIAGALLQALDDAPLRPTAITWSICASRSPTSGARPTGAPITRWCASAPSPNP